MKVLEKGAKPKPKKEVPKWVGLIVFCDCGFQGKLEEGDNPNIGILQHVVYKIKCPTCGGVAHT